MFRVSGFELRVARVWGEGLGFWASSKGLPGFRVQDLGFWASSKGLRV